MAVGKIMVENCIVYIYICGIFDSIELNYETHVETLISSFSNIYLKFIISIHLDILSSNIFTGSQISFHFPSRPLVSL